MNDIYILFGSNIDKEENICAAIELLNQMCQVVSVSSVYETSPVGMNGQPDFFNVVVHIQTSMVIQQFKQNVLSVIEKSLKRVRVESSKNAPRTIDADILLFNDEIIDYDNDHHIPDPDLTKYLHIAVPISEIAPSLIHPETGESMLVICKKLTDSYVRGHQPKPEVKIREDINLQKIID